MLELTSNTKQQIFCRHFWRTAWTRTFLFFFVFGLTYEDILLQTYIVFRMYCTSGHTVLHIQSPYLLFRVCHSKCTQSKGLNLCAVSFRNGCKTLYFPLFPPSTSCKACGWDLWGKTSLWYRTAMYQAVAVKNLTPVTRALKQRNKLLKLGFCP